MLIKKRNEDPNTATLPLHLRESSVSLMTTTELMSYDTDSRNN